MHDIDQGDPKGMDGIVAIKRQLQRGWIGKCCQTAAYDHQRKKRHETKGWIEKT
jgi:hypothetical protein